MLDNNSHSRIKKLSPLLINQLAAGEVVTRPAAVVKELLENAIDANATHIEVHITQGGMGRIEVIDNGVGIHPEDMVMAMTRHATSKVADIANLQGITTLGFRGEALAATAAVSRVTLTSSHDDSGIGRQLHVAGVLAEIPKLKPVVHKRGTTVTVKDLYFNVPARRGNLKSIATEFAHIETIVREVALACADVSLILSHDQKQRLSLSASAAESQLSKGGSYLSLSRLEQALGESLSAEAIEIKVDLTCLLQQSAMIVPTSEVGAEAGSEVAVANHISSPIADQQASIHGWLWPTYHSQPTLPKLLYVNGRLVKEPIINNQLRQLAANAQIHGLGYALYFALPSHWLNINVHPTKQRIKISPLNNIMAHLSHAIRLKLKDISIAPLSDAVLPTPQPMNRALSKHLPKHKVSVNQAVASRPQQVQSVQQRYQHQHVMPSSTLSPQPSRKLSAYNSKNTAPHQPPKDAVTHATNLPQCLSIIDDLPSTVKRSFFASTDTDLPSLPWLLFYHQGQLLLISNQAWQQQITPLFDQKVFDIKGFEWSEYNANTNHATVINNKLTEFISSLSTAELSIVTTNFVQTVNDCAFKALNTEELLTLMLVPKPQ